MRAVAYLLSCLFAVLALSKPAQACSVCGCDPSGGTLGLDRPTQSDLRVGLEDRYLQKESGSGDDAESEKEDRLNIRIQYSPPVPRLSLQLEIPIYIWKAHFDSTGAQDDTNRGLSDIALTARYEILKVGGLIPKHVVALTGTLKMPTGNNDHLAAVDDGTPDEHKQIGTGSWDEFVGAWYTYGDFPTVAYAGVNVRINGSNARGNHYGNALLATAGVRRSFLESRHLFFALDAQVRNAGKDTVPGYAYDPDSGGLIVYAALTAGYAITDQLLARAIVQIPVIKNLNGTQGEHPVGFLALAYDFGL